MACGGVPSAPDIPGVEHAINSDGFFELEKQPKKARLVLSHITYSIHKDILHKIVKFHCI